MPRSAAPAPPTVLRLGLARELRVRGGTFCVDVFMTIPFYELRRLENSRQKSERHSHVCLRAQQEFSEARRTAACRKQTGHLTPCCSNSLSIFFLQTPASRQAVARHPVSGASAPRDRRLTHFRRSKTLHLEQRPCRTSYSSFLLTSHSSQSPVTNVCRK